VSLAQVSLVVLSSVILCWFSGCCWWRVFVKEKEEEIKMVKMNKKVLVGVIVALSLIDVFVPQLPLSITETMIEVAQVVAAVLIVK
jgi:hypothetical protein